MLCIAVITSISACANKTETDTKKAIIEDSISKGIRRYLEANIRESGEDLKIDSVVILELDTLTEHLDSLYSLRAMRMKYKQLEDEEAQLAKDISESDPDDAYYYKLVNHSYEMVDIIATQYAKMMVLEAKLSECDSTTLLGYNAIINVEAHNSKNVSKGWKDFFFLDKNFHILEAKKMEFETALDIYE